MKTRRQSSALTRNSSPRSVDLALKRQLAKALPLAANAALEAGAFIKSKFGRFRQLSEKPDASLVTEVDKRSEKIVLRHLRKAFPGDEIVAEETGLCRGKVGSSQFRWHVDPLDGTTNFVHGFPFFCVSIGLEHEDSDFVLGVIYQPLTGDLYSGHRYAGAYKNKKRIHVSGTSKLAHCLLSTGFSMRKESHFKDEIATFTQITRLSHAVRRTGSAALDLAHVATGQFDGFWERGLSSWDMAAALALITEAGGTFSRMDGKTFRLGDESILASNGKIHSELVEAARF